MKLKKSKTWEVISEGIVTSSEITYLEKYKIPITLCLTPVNHPLVIMAVHIVSGKRKTYEVINNMSIANGDLKKMPYKYLSCAVRRAVKEYKTLLRTNKYKMATK